MNNNNPARRRVLLGCASAVLLGASGCATTEGGTASAGASTSAAKPAPEVFGAIIYHENGRIFNFADSPNYKQFLSSGELAYLRTFIGAGKNGETMVYALTKDEGSKKDISAAEMFMRGDVKDAPNFYGEIIKHGRFHVFGEYGDWKDFLANGEMTFTFTDIGGGPGGKTVVYAQNKKTQGKRPDALIAKFKAFHGMK